MRTVTRKTKPPVDWTGFAYPKTAPVRLKGKAYTEFKISIFERDGYRCRNPKCYEFGTPEDHGVLTVHHDKARSQGGEDTPGNCYTFCVWCHSLIELREITFEFLKYGGKK